MSIEKVKELLTVIQADPQTKDALSNLVLNDKKDEIVRCCVAAAKRQGLSVTEKDILDAIASAAVERMKKTEQAASGVEKLADESLDKVTGGEEFCHSWDKNDCKSTFLIRENCWTNDGCDKNVNEYKYYLCDHNDAGRHCSSGAVLDCSEFIF